MYQLGVALIAKMYSRRRLLRWRELAALVKVGGSIVLVTRSTYKGSLRRGYPIVDLL
jgi:hypothetical protein